MVVVVLLVTAAASAQTKSQESSSGPSGQPAKSDKTDKTAKATDNYDELLAQYLSEARAEAAAAPTPGSLWMATLTSDLRARRINDLVTIRVVENVTGAGTADSNLDKKSSGSLAVPNLFGLESHLPSSMNPASLVNFNSNTAFQGGGATARTGALSAVLTARVREVLPNGDLVIEGVREIEINGDRQMLVLTGVVRPVDLNTGNVVPSTAIGQMRIRYFGRGLMKDNLSPGWLVRILNKIF
jgi:flagellar L-ring protein precursor FlgH